MPECSEIVVFKRCSSYCKTLSKRTLNQMSCCVLVDIAHVQISPPVLAWTTDIVGYFPISSRVVRARHLVVSYYVLPIYRDLVFICQVRSKLPDERNIVSVNQAELLE